MIRPGIYHKCTIVMYKTQMKRETFFFFIFSFYFCQAVDEREICTYRRDQEYVYARAARARQNDTWVLKRALDRDTFCPHCTPFNSPRKCFQPLSFPFFFLSLFISLSLSSFTIFYSKSPCTLLYVRARISRSITLIAWHNVSHILIDKKDFNTRI